MNYAALVKFGVKYTVKYTVIYAGLTMFVIYLGSDIVGYPFGLAAMVLFLGSLIVAPLLLGASDVGIETAEAGAEAGYLNVTNPSQFDPTDFSFPGRVQIVFYLIGVASFSVIGVMLISQTHR